MVKNDFQYGGWNYYALQCGMWLWNHDSEFTKWQRILQSDLIYAAVNLTREYN